jgi:4-amino-4-deoxy-L-arabinose transferase-like glycosyltransferase
VRRPALFLLFLCIFTFFLGLGRQAITDADEAYYAESAREMVERGDWLTPYYNYEYRWQKPVLYYWLTAITYLVTGGANEWAARLWAALAGLGLAFVTASAARSMTRQDDVGWLSGAIVGTTFGCFALARMSLPDLPLTFFITLTIACAFEERWMLAGLAAGLGFLTKGPLALVVPGLVIVPAWWVARSRWPLGVRQLGPAAAIFALVALPWYVGMTAEHGTAYLKSFFVSDNFERFATDKFNDPRSSFFYVPVLLGGLLPWTSFLIVALWRRGREMWDGRLALRDDEWRLLIWAAMPFLFFSISIGKQPRYILPVLPPFAIMLARSILHRLETARTGHRGARREMEFATYATAVVMAVSALLLARTRELFFTAIPELTWIAVAALLVCAVTLVVVASRHRFAQLPVLLSMCGAITLISIQFGALAGLRPEPVEEMAALVRQNRTANESIGVHHVFVRNLIFYTGVPQQDLFADDRTIEFMRASERVLLVVMERDLARLEQAAGLKMVTLGAVRYFNTANIKLRSLVVPKPEEDIQRVLLVANR